MSEDENDIGDNWSNQAYQEDNSLISLPSCSYYLSICIIIWQTEQDCTQISGPLVSRVSGHGSTTHPEHLTIPTGSTYTHTRMDSNLDPACWCLFPNVMKHIISYHRWDVCVLLCLISAAFSHFPDPEAVRGLTDEVLTPQTVKQSQKYFGDGLYYWVINGSAGVLYCGFWVPSMVFLTSQFETIQTSLFAPSKGFLCVLTSCFPSLRLHLLTSFQLFSCLSEETRKGWKNHKTPGCELNQTPCTHTVFMDSRGADFWKSAMKNRRKKADESA